VFLYGEPIAVPADAGRDLMESRRAALERALQDLTDRAEAMAAGGERSGGGRSGP
jgi:hypothetical protein